MSENFLLRNYDRYPLTMESGSGCYLFDTHGRRYLDMIAGIGVNVFGHCHPRLTAALVEQAHRAVHFSNLVSNQYQSRLAERLCRISGLDRAFFCNSGTEAVEAALKAVRARSRPGKQKLVALHGSFHGRTMASLSVTGQSDLRQRFVYSGAEVAFVHPNDSDGLREAVSPDTAAVILEPVLGEGGIYPLHPEFLQLARKLSSAADAYLIVDEVQCGLGRTGKYFAYQWAGIRPDIAVVAKPLAGGLPLGAALFTEDAAQWLPPHSHGTTFGGGPLACRVALEVLDLLHETLPSVAGKAEEFLSRLESLRLRHPVIREIRSKGLMFGLQLDRPGLPYVYAALERRLLINCTQGSVLRLLPPFIVATEQMDECFSVLDEVFANGRLAPSSKADIMAVDEHAFAAATA
jgi:predicted acetylornithine/succinylornithine family transaminase